jgi:hypothetical protein
VFKTIELASEPLALRLDLSSPSSGTAICLVAITAPTIPFLFVLFLTMFGLLSVEAKIEKYSRCNQAPQLLLDQNVDVTLQHFCLGVARIGQLAHNVHDFPSMLKRHNLYFVQQALWNLQI